jgi:biopolymer transport protein ExbB
VQKILTLILIFTLPIAVSRAQEGDGSLLDDLEFGDDVIDMQMEDAGEGDAKRFSVVTDEDVSTLAVDDIYKNNGSFFKVVEIGSKGSKGGKFTVERTRGSFDPTQSWTRISGQGPLSIQSRETLFDRFFNGGPLMWPLALLLLLTIVLAVQGFLHLRPKKHCPEEFMTSARKAIDKGDLDRFEELAIKTPGLLPHSARAMMVRFEESTVQELGERSQAAARRQVARMRFPVRLLGFVAVVAPLLGLLGTVLGLIMSFDSIGGGAADAGKAATMAAGIKVALMTTAFGLIVAVPALFFAFVFNHKLRLLITDCEVGADEILHDIARLRRRAGETESVETGVEATPPEPTTASV